MLSSFCRCSTSFGQSLRHATSSSYFSWSSCWFDREFGIVSATKNTHSYFISFKKLLVFQFRRRQAKILYGESSMRNGFGLRLLHKFLGLPFLQLQKETLTALLDRNQRDTEVCTMELTEFLVDYSHLLLQTENILEKHVFFSPGLIRFRL